MRSEFGSIARHTTDDLIIADAKCFDWLGPCRAVYRQLTAGDGRPFHSKSCYGLPPRKNGQYGWKSHQTSFCNDLMPKSSLLAETGHERSVALLPKQSLKGLLNSETCLTAYPCCSGKTTGSCLFPQIAPSSHGRPTGQPERASKLGGDGSRRVHSEGAKRRATHFLAKIWDSSSS